MAYKYILNEYEINKLNLIENDNIRLNLMSVLSYLHIYNERKNSDFETHQLNFLEKKEDELKISFAKLHKAYTRSHAKISLQTLKNRIQTLIELKIIKIIGKVQKTNVYQFISSMSDNMSNNMSNEKQIEDIENTNIKADSKKHKYESRTTIKDLDSSNNSSADFNYDNYIKDERKVSDFEIVSKKLNELLKIAKVRSPWIKNKVINKVCKYYNTISAKHLEAYICKCIENARNDYYSSYNQSKINTNKNDEYKVIMPDGINSHHDLEEALVH